MYFEIIRTLLLLLLATAKKNYVIFMQICSSLFAFEEEANLSKKNVKKGRKYQNISLFHDNTSN